MSNSVLLVMDYINDIVHEEGKLSGKGYAKYVKKNKVIMDVNAAIDKAKENGVEVIYINTGFKSDYIDKPKNSVLFEHVEKQQALIFGSWGTELHEDLLVIRSSKVISKNRISPFYGTILEKYLRDNKIKDIYMCGVATGLVVESAAREAHDRDFVVLVLKDCCGDSSAKDHKAAIENIEEFAHVITLKDFF